MIKGRFKPSKISVEIALSCLFLILVLAHIIINWGAIPPRIPWFYSLPFGEDQLMRKEGLILVIVSNIALIIISSFLPQWVKKEDKIIEKTVSVSFMLISVLMSINILKMLQIFI